MLTVRDRDTHWPQLSSSNESDPSSGLVHLPHIQTLVLVQTLVKLVGGVALGQDALTCLVKPHHVWVSHLTQDAINGVDRFGAPEERERER